MEKIINSYETLYVIDPDLTEDATKALVEKFTALINANGTASEVNEWGKRKLAYPINDKTEGYYVLVNFTSEGSSARTRKNFRYHRRYSPFRRNSSRRKEDSKG